MVLANPKKASYASGDSNTASMDMSLKGNRDVAVGHSNELTLSSHWWKGLHLHHKRNPRAHNATHKPGGFKPVSSKRLA